MYIYLARQNVQIYLLGGLLLALIGIFAVAYANYVEDRRTLALLRIRGAGPLQVVRFFIPNIIGPSLAGFVIGALIALAGGYGITKLVWELRQLQTVLNYLPTHLALLAAHRDHCRPAPCGGDRYRDCLRTVGLWPHRATKPAGRLGYERE